MLIILLSITVVILTAALITKHFRFEDAGSHAVAQNAGNDVKAIILELEKAYDRITELEREKAALKNEVDRLNKAV